MSYATVSDVQSRMLRDLSVDEQALCETLLEDAGVIIDAFNINAVLDSKKVVSCRMVIRALGTDDSDIPMGATQGSMSALGYSQSWTMSGGASVGELYLSKLDKQLLGYGNRIGSYSPVQEMAVYSV